MPKLQWLEVCTLDKKRKIRRWENSYNILNSFYRTYNSSVHFWYKKSTSLSFTLSYILLATFSFTSDFFPCFKWSLEWIFNICHSICLFINRGLDWLFFTTYHSKNFVISILVAKIIYVHQIRLDIQTYFMLFRYFFQYLILLLDKICILLYNMHSLLFFKTITTFYWSSKNSVLKNFLIIK